MIYIALLRGINVGGNKMVAMADLRDALAKMGFTGVATILQSGNAVFEGTASKTDKLEALLEKEMEKRLGVVADFHVRTADEWKTIVGANPFAAEAKKDPARLHVSCFKAPLDKGRVKQLQAAIAAIKGPERVYADGRQLYMTFPDGMGNSKAAALVEKVLVMRGTARNWNTVLKLSQLSAR